MVKPKTETKTKTSLLLPQSTKAYVTAQVTARHGARHDHSRNWCLAGKIRGSIHGSIHTHPPMIGHYMVFAIHQRSRSMARSGSTALRREGARIGISSSTRQGQSTNSTQQHQHTALSPQSTNAAAAWYAAATRHARSAALTGLEYQSQHMPHQCNIPAHVPSTSVHRCCNLAHVRTALNTAAQTSKPLDM